MHEPLTRFDKVLNAIVGIVLVTVFAACAIVLITSCTPKPAQKEKIWPTGAPGNGGGTSWFWCFAGQLDEDRDNEGGLVCMDTEDSCAEARGEALRFGGYAHIASVGECTQIEVAP